MTPVRGQKLIVSTMLGNAPFVEHDHPIGANDRSYSTRGMRATRSTVSSWHMQPPVR